jgi:hypothetical protein
VKDISNCITSVEYTQMFMDIAGTQVRSADKILTNAVADSNIPASKAV